MKRNKDVSEENVQRETREEQSNKFSRKSLKFAVSIIMLVDIHIALLLYRVYIPWRRNEMCKLSTLCDRLFSLSVFLLNLCLLKIV